MAKVTTRTPPLISLYFCQERGDPDYGSCLWAVFNFDLERYELSITSDCGNYAYGWVPTHKSESFMHLMARSDSGYLLDKLASPCVINEEATFEAVKELMESWGVDFSETDRWGDPVFDMDEIKNCCNQSDERDVYDALKQKFKGTSMEDCDDYDLWGCIQKDFTANAKKIVQVFMDYIQPKCKEFSESETNPTAPPVEQRNGDLIISRSWAMPNSRTFSIPPIRTLIEKYISSQEFVIDPSSNNNHLATVTNDLDPACDADYHLDALDFLKSFDDSSVDAVLYDPPYSPRQVSECYTRLGRTVDMQTTQASYWSNQKKEIGRIVKPGGVVITCGWNSGGIGKKYGFEIQEILLVAHGGWHNDTIVTVEKKKLE